MVFGAVKTHGGFVEMDSAEGKGSTFHIYLPLLNREKQDFELFQDTVDCERGRGETILLADDQEQVLEIGVAVLEELGYRVLTAVNGKQALEIFEAHAEEIDLCIFDIVMPEMDGSKAALHVRQIKPDAKIIFSTGYDRPGRDEMKHEMVISKPFSIDKMSRLIRRKLEDSAHRLG
ncbi:MAG: response regulator [Mariprofundus sp.]|nr:response regulator [Mariprofundus sp.]